MSDMEHNKGRLIPTHIDTEHFTEDDFETYRENGFEVIDGEIYEVEWDIRRGELYGFQRAEVDQYGVIHFETYHYNGGGHWTECVEAALNDHQETV